MSIKTGDTVGTTSDGDILLAADQQFKNEQERWAYWEEQADKKFGNRPTKHKALWIGVRMQKKGGEI